MHREKHSEKGTLGFKQGKSRGQPQKSFKEVLRRHLNNEGRRYTWKIVSRGRVKKMQS